jgi:hypothetical protein
MRSGLLPPALIILLLTSGATAYAECAWVLWGSLMTTPPVVETPAVTEESPFTEQWRVIRGTKDIAGCERQLKSQLSESLGYAQKLKKDGMVEEIRPSGDGLFVQWKPLPKQLMGQTASYLFICLPTARTRAGRRAPPPRRPPLRRPPLRRPPPRRPPPRGYCGSKGQVLISPLSALPSGPGPHARTVKPTNAPGRPDQRKAVLVS